MKGRRDREYDRLLAAARGNGTLVEPDEPADIGAVLMDVNKLLDVDVQKERLQKALRDAKAEAAQLLKEREIERPQAEALRRKVIDLTNKNKVLQLAVDDALKPDYSAAEVNTAKMKVRHAEGRQRTAELIAAELDGHARASEERTRKAEALVEHAQQHARDAEAAIKDAIDRAEKAHDEGLKEGKTITAYAMAAAKQMLAAKRAGTIKAMTDDPTDDIIYQVRKALQIEDRVREELGMPPKPGAKDALKYL